MTAASNITVDSDEARAAKAPLLSPQQLTRTFDALDDKEFELFRDLIFDIAGISLAPIKKALIAGRLGKRLRFYGLNSYHDYYLLISSPANRNELQVAVNLLTTNETYFFRETKHFDFLRNEVLAKRQQGQGFRVWSAASSSGEEAYSIAMLLADCLGNASWEVLASDISTRVLDDARKGIYPLTRTRDIPRHYLKRYCLKGTGDYEGKLLVEQSLRKRVEFRQLNLNESLPELGRFDAIFLRNVLIYFNQDTKRQVVQRLQPFLKPDGCFLIGHSETLHGVNETLQQVQPSVYRLV